MIAVSFGSLLQLLQPLVIVFCLDFLAVNLEGIVVTHLEEGSAGTQSVSNNKRKEGNPDNDNQEPGSVTNLL